MRRIFSVFVLIIFITVILVGCVNEKLNDSDAVSKNATHSSTEQTSEPEELLTTVAKEITTPEAVPAPTDENGNVIFPEESAITDQETIYYVMDDTTEEIVVYFTEHHPQVKAIKEVINRYWDLMNNRDYRTIKGDEEYETYTQDLIDFLRDKKDDVNSAKIYKDATMVTTSLGISEYEEFKFNVLVTECLATFKARFRIDEISDATSKETGAKAGHTYELRTLLKLVKQEDGSWKIDDKGKSGYWEVE